jgi:hypothetical protein
MGEVFAKVKHWPKSPDLKVLFDERVRKAADAMAATYA